MIATKPAIPKAVRRAPTLAGVAPCANAPTVVATRTGYRTISHRANARTREAIRVDKVRVK